MSPPQATIKVHVLNFHSLYSHIEIVLENTSTNPHTFYGINRWATPSKNWRHRGPNYLIEEASSVYSFDIHADPDDITKNWTEYWKKTKRDASILGKNCAVAAQWFLTTFAGIPEPDISNVSWNHLALGILWPSFIPCPITLPGRVMSNVQFHIESKNNPEAAMKYSELFLQASLALAIIAMAASITAIIVASVILTGGIAAAVITTAIVAGAASSYGFFKACNVFNAQIIANNTKMTEEPPQSDASLEMHA